LPGRPLGTLVAKQAVTPERQDKERSRREGRREAGVQGDLRQGQVRPCLQELPGPLDAAQDHVLVRGQPGGGLELPGEVVGAEAGGRR
jgi:hypothetical protein